MIRGDPRGLVYRTKCWLDLPVFVTVDEVGLGSGSFPSAGAVFFVCVDLAWDAVNCFLCGIRFAEH